MSFHSFEDLDVWKRACQLAVEVYRVLRSTNDFGLRDQMQRAAVSIASNIAEGAERGGRDFLRYIAIARGSSSELRTQAYIASEIDAISMEARNQIIGETKGINRMLFGLASSISNSPST